MESEEIKSEFENAVSEADNSLSECTRILSSLRETVSRLDTYSVELPSRLEGIRRRGYVYHAWLEDRLEKLIEGWMRIRRDVMRNVEKIESIYEDQIDRLRSELDGLQVTIEPTESDLESARVISMQADSLRSSLSHSVERLKDSLDDLVRSFSSISGTISRAEYALDELARSKVQLRSGEHIVSVYRVKLLGGKEKKKGYLYVTSERLIFEEEWEEVLKKVLFIATKKRKVRRVAFETPIGYVANVSVGRVGFFAGKGVYITLSQGGSLTFDMEDRLVGSLVKDINYVLTGQADRDMVKADVKEAGMKIRVIKCPYCGAPVQVPLVRGVRSVKCEYCGSTIALQ